MTEKQSCLRAFGEDVNGVLVSVEHVSDLFLDLSTSFSLFRQSIILNETLVSLVFSKRGKQEYTRRKHSQQSTEPSTLLRYIFVARIEPRPHRWNARTNHCANPVPTLHLRDSLKKYLTPDTQDAKINSLPLSSCVVQIL